MQYVFAAFRQPRGPLGATAAGRKGDDDEDDDTVVPTSPADRAIERSLSSFERLFDLLLSQSNGSRSAVAAFDLTQYVCERLAPPPARASEWLRRLIDALSTGNSPPERRLDVAAAILTQFATEPDPGAERPARARLLRLGYDLSGPPPEPDLCQGFHSVLPQIERFDALWGRIQTVRTYKEQAAAYLRALKAKEPTAEYQEFLAHNPEEKRALEDAFRLSNPWTEILVMNRWAGACPRHHIALPTGERSKLRTYAVARARNCCSNVVIWTGD
jgi:hypothetical protein